MYGAPENVAITKSVALAVGEANMKIQIGRTVFHHQISVAVIWDDIITGKDILQEYDVGINLKYHHWKNRPLEISR